MSGRLFAGRLAAAGLDALEVPAKVRLYDSVLHAFHRRTGTGPDYVWWVPGRLEVFGTHTDYAGGRTLVAAVPRGFAFAASARADAQVRAEDAASEESVTIDPTSPTSASIGARGARPLLARATGAYGWRHYVEVVVERLARNFPGAQAGADIVFASDLPRAAGMSSSSALMVGIATALVRLWEIRARPEWRAHVRGLLDEAGYYACIENGRNFGDLAGDSGVGTHGGSEDHAALLCGQPGALSAYAFVPMRHLDTVGVPDDWRFIITPSGVAAEKTGAALDSYNRLARGAEVLLDLWNRCEAPHASLASALVSDPSAPARLRDITRASRVDGWPADALESRLQHFIREDARVPRALQAFRHGDAEMLRAIAAASQTDSAELLRNQVQETVVLARRALECGAFAARSFGAGFGGSVWALVQGDHAEWFAPSWHPAAFRAQPGPSVMDLTA